MIETNLLRPNDDTLSLNLDSTNAPSLIAQSRGLTILFQKGTQGVEIETDSELAIDQIQNGPNTNSPYKALIEDARFQLKRCDCLLRHTLREGNRCADKLASLGVEQGEHVVLLEDPPEEVKNLVIADMTGVSVLRD
ncbi:unnamed protein product [Camellia sinensis]